MTHFPDRSQPTDRPSPGLKRLRVQHGIFLGAGWCWRRLQNPDLRLWGRPPATPSIEAWPVKDAFVARGGKARGRMGADSLGRPHRSPKPTRKTWQEMKFLENETKLRGAHDQAETEPTPAVQ